MPEPWRITLLGGLRAQLEDRVITRFKYQKVGGLLAYLAYYSRQMHSREILVDIFWPESGPETARNNLSAALSSLRHQFEPPGTATGTVLRADRYSVGLIPAMIATDVAGFEAAIREAHKTEGAAERRHSLERAVDLYQGRLLPGYYEEWIAPEQERLAGLCFDAVTVLLSDLERQGDFSTALRYARQAVSADPLREEAHHHLIRLLVAAGQPAAALRQYKEWERLLEAEIGEEPSAPLRALARQLEMQVGLAAPALSAATAGSAGVSPAHSPAHPFTRSPALPLTVTLLLTDIEGSTRQGQGTGGTDEAALAAYHAMLRAQLATHGGHEIKGIGDARVVAFQSAGKALACAVAAQQELSEGPANPPHPQHPLRSGKEANSAGHPLTPSHPHPLKIRMALHTGDMEAEGEDYRGPALHRASRMLIAARGGQILLSDATAGLIRRDLSKEIRLVDLGVYRLRDVPTPERLYQVEYPGMATAAFPPLSAEAGYRSHLPAQVNRFFGREREIALLRELLLPTLDPLPKREGATAPTPDLLPKRDGAATAHPPSRFGKGAGGLGPAPSRLITLSGPGGTGKTRLALEVAERLSESYHGAVWFVGLGDLADSSLIGGAILDALRVPRSPQRDAVDQVVETLAHQPSLLVLDNYEHLVDDGAVLVRTLLGRVPSLTVLVTSRKLLGLAGEQEFAVSPLSTPNGGETAEQLSLYDSVALFVDRAQSAMPHFQVTTHNAPAVAELCQRLEGIPLALELAAARALVLTPTQMLSQLEQRFEFLVSRKRDATERHRTLQAAVDWSYRLLSPELQRSFARLSVFRGGWTVEAAEAVCEEPLALDYLAQLRECSLVLTDEAGSEMRFRMLETLREYASERLSAADQGAVQQRHRDYFLRLAEEAKEKLIGPDQGVSLNKLEVEHDNLRLALTFCVEEPKGAETGLRLSAALWKFWETRGHLREGQERLIALLSLPLAQEHTNARAAALNAAGVLCRRQGDYAAAQALHEESLAISRELGDLQGIANSLNDLGSVARAKSDYISARSLHEEGLDLFRKLGDRPGIAACLNNLGNVAKDQCDYSNARSLFEESLAIQRQLGNRHAIATSLGNLGIVAEKVSDYASARSLYGQCLAIFRELGSKWGIAAFVHNLGVVAREQKDFASAYSLFQEALIINREIGNRAWEANNLCCLGNVATDMGDYASARLLHQEALAISRALGDRSAVAASLGNQGMLAYLQGDYASARALFEAALVIVREIGNRAWEAWNLQNIGCVTTAQGDHISARPQYVESLQIYRDLGDRQGVASSLEAFAGLNAREDRLEPAARIWSAAERLREEIGAPIHPVNRQEYDREAAAARKALGDEAFTAAWAAGRGMTWEEAVAYALDEAAS